MEKQFKYDAFISYRHTELDAFVAGNMHKMLESYKLPRNVAKKRTGQKNKIERVFRDKEELLLTQNLEEPILEALQDSEWLIVVCSPRLKESIWCKKEIETFISLRGRSHILAVLVEGEPSESFPEELTYEIREVKQPDGTLVKERVELEPLAADFRGKSKREIKKTMSREILRVLAPMFNLSYDDLRQRHRERRLRRLVAMSLGTGAACFAVGANSTINAIRINEQKEKIEFQSEQILEQSDEIRKQAEELEKKNEEMLLINKEITGKNAELALHQANALSELAERYFSEGNKAGAKALTLQVLTKQDGVQLPYSARAQRVLTECLSVYEVGGIYKAEYQLKASGRIAHVKQSGTRDVIAIYDESKSLRLYDVEQRKELFFLGPDEHEISNEKSFTFLGKDTFVYIGADDKAHIYNYRENSMEEAWENDSTTYEVWADKSGKYLLLETMDEVAVYNGETLERMGEIVKGTEENSNDVIFLADGKIVYMMSERDVNDWEYIQSTAQVWDLNTSEKRYEFDLGKVIVEEVIAQNGVLYVLSGEYSSSFFECDTHVTAFSLQTGEKMWDTVFPGSFPEENGLYAGDDWNQLLCLTADCMYFVDLITGESTLVTGKGTKVLNVLAAGSNDYFLFMENGDLFLLDTESKMLWDQCEQFLCATPVNSKLMFGIYGFLVLAENDDKITYYATQCGPDVTETEKELVMPERIEIKDTEDAMKIAAEMGAERPECARYAFYDKMKHYCMVLYWDESMEVFDVTSKTLLSTLDHMKLINRCVGPDVNGWMYLWGTTEGYILNEQMDMVARIKNVEMFDVDNRKVYVRRGDVNYEIPVYDLDALIALAEEK